MMLPVLRVRLLLLLPPVLLLLLLVLTTPPPRKVRDTLQDWRPAERAFLLAVKLAAPSQRAKAREQLGYVRESLAKAEL